MIIAEIFSVHVHATSSVTGRIIVPAMQRYATGVPVKTKHGVEIIRVIRIPVVQLTTRICMGIRYLLNANVKYAQDRHVLWTVPLGLTPV